MFENDNETQSIQNIPFMSYLLLSYISCKDVLKKERKRKQLLIQVMINK